MFALAAIVDLIMIASIRLYIHCWLQIAIYLSDVKTFERICNYAVVWMEGSVQALSLNKYSVGLQWTWAELSWAELPLKPIRHNYLLDVNAWRDSTPGTAAGQPITQITWFYTNPCIKNISRNPAIRSHRLWPRLFPSAVLSDYHFLRPIMLAQIEQCLWTVFW